MKNMEQNNRIKLQKEGLELGKRLLEDLLYIGLKNLSGTEHRAFVLQGGRLGDYCLFELQKIWQSILREIRNREYYDGKRHDDAAIYEMEKFRAMLKKVEQELTLEQEIVEEKSLEVWEAASFLLEGEDIQSLRERALTSLEEEVKKAKEQIKNVLGTPWHLCLIAYEMLAKRGEQMMLKTISGETIQLGDSPYFGECMEEMQLLLEEYAMKNQVLLGILFYDAEEERIKLHPVSVITEKEICNLGGLYHA